MNRVASWIKERKKIIIVLALIVLLVAVVYLFFGTDSNDTTSVSVSKTDTEIKLEALLEAIDGVGDAEVMITSDDDGICGVVIVCEGASSIMVRNDILNAVSTALNINKNIIAIYSM